ncbi:MAG: DnaJ domain-containing protein [Cenarchaeum sp. SB0665_bin_23]|nr:DnaJ domain-containing protein [Cenarchaeum sp. SB0664_bin_35]MXY61540.1 DnaJ domain-containing protein [Cenarchaeum sp. SB0665_bin_23]MXZ93805.1 DnaJ domain-containing protein [Cenarchaeum sp. SB0666_bin_15]MYB46974.1 DnaJ domain-containing protein [Cenarchaeum sp. SB0662_bin_33]MYD58791.1 DnaJ domain-containing protein [Cenarchaeum sp. SB0678_bin_8]MYG33270.1 DnaJ domain-containing protein [Cenarchaeum sp. SB0677_bin_16]MYJ27591.1 DnaJ domain-containing protein [Cenarchaeum sp. SB0672_bi
MNVAKARDILNVEKRSTPTQIKAAYRRLVLEYHPDKKGGDEKQFQLITEAYHLLIDNEHVEEETPTSNNVNRAQWGAGPTDHIPEEDWSKYTREFEEDEAWWKAYETRFWEEYEGRNSSGGKSESAREPNRQPRLRVNVDQSLCIGCCSCETIAPNVFEINRRARSNPKSTVKDEAGAGVNRIMNAAETCPTKAILVDNVDTGERLYPF